MLSPHMRQHSMPTWTREQWYKNRTRENVITSVFRCCMPKARLLFIVLFVYRSILRHAIGRHIVPAAIYQQYRQMFASRHAALMFCATLSPAYSVTAPLLLILLAIRRLPTPASVDFADFFAWLLLDTPPLASNAVYSPLTPAAATMPITFLWVSAARKEWL